MLFRRNCATKEPCALRGYLGRGAASTVKYQPPEKHLAYLHWVSRLKCPNYHCRKAGFQSMESYSGHVSNCPHRLEASYWCPSCDKAEYLGVEDFGDGSFAINQSYKGSTMKRAGDFLKRFRNPDGKKSRKNSRRGHAGSAELETLPVYPYGRAEIDSHQNTEQPPASSIAKQKPHYPESPDNIGCYELEESYRREPSGKSSTASKSIWNVRCPDENGSDSQSSTIQEVESSNPKLVSASNPSTGRERVKISSRSSVNSQRKSRSELRLSTPGRPFENGPAVYNFEQSGVSNTRMSRSSIAHSSQPGSSIVELSGKAPLQSNSRSLIAAGPGQSDDGVVSPLSPDFLQSGGQPKQGLASTTTSLAPLGHDNVQQFWAKQSVATAFQRSGNDIGTGETTKQQIPETFTTSTSKNLSTLASLTPGDSPYLSRQDSPKGIQQHGNENAPKQARAAVNQSPLSASQVTTNTAIEDIGGEIADHPGQQTLEAHYSSTRAQVEHLHQLMRVFKGQWKGYSENWPEVSGLLAERDTSSLLNDGLEAFAQYLSGNPPTTFGGVFALVKFADACACTCHHQKTSLARSSFYQNALRWGEKITDRQDHRRFVKLIHLLWQVPLHDRSDDLNHTSDLKSSLGSGALIDACVRFLDGFEYAYLIERTRSSSENVDASHTDSATRNRLLEQTVRVQLISAQLERTQQFAVASSDSAGYAINAMNIPGLEDSESPSWPTPGLSSNSYDSFASRATFQTPTSSYSSVGDSSIKETRHPWTGEPKLASLITDSSFPCLSEDKRDRNPSPARTFCPSCGQEFTGKQKNRPSNLKRHMNTAHHKGPRPECTMKDCGRIFQRSDGLKKHLKSAHNLPPDVVECQAADDETLPENSVDPNFA